MKNEGVRIAKFSIFTKLTGLKEINRRLPDIIVEKENDTEQLLIAGLKKALAKMLDYKIRMGQDIVIGDASGKVIVMKAEDYAKTLKERNEP